MSCKEQGNAAVTVISFVLLITLAAISYWIWAQRGQLAQASSMVTESAHTLGPCSDLKLDIYPTSPSNTKVWRAVISNNGANSCELTGYPAVFVQMDANRTIGATSKASPPATKQVLAPNGGKVHTIIEQTQADKVCIQAVSTTLQMYLPNITQPLQAPFEASMCATYTATALQSGE